MSVNGWRSGAGTGATATTAAPGVVELATTGETQEGTDTTRAVTPAGGAATYLTQVSAADLFNSLYV